jgi:hypothetical protein
MARRTVVHLVDDLDDTIIGDDNGETVSFGLNGTDYEIDLTDEHADELRATLARYVEAVRKASGGRRTRTSSRSRPSKSDFSPVAVREWAKANGVEVSPGPHRTGRGRAVLRGWELAG